MSYESMKPSKDNKVQGKNLNVVIHKWEKADQSIIGRLLSIGKFKSEKWDKEQNEYIIETDYGRVSVLLNSASDKIFESNNLVGKIVYIVFKGKTSLPDGRSFKNFDIMEIADK